MDGQTLQSIFESPNFSLWNPASEAFNQDQQKAQQALLAAQGQEQRDQAMQPLEQAHKQATTGYNQALTKQLESNMAAQPPAEERMKLAMSEYRKKMSDAQSAEEDTKMQRRMQYAEMASKNNGVLPLEYLNSLPEDERAHYASPQATQRTQALARAWYDTHPKTIENRAKEAAALERATVAAGPGYARAAAVGKAGGRSATGMTPDKAIGYWNNMAAQETDPDLKAQYQAEGDRNELIVLRRMQAAAQARGEQGLDIPATQAGGKPVNKTPTPLAPTKRVPAVGTIEDGHRFKGGDPANPSNWVKQ